MKSHRRPTKTARIEIVDLAYNGKAVGRLDGKVVFLNSGLPGETVLARITKEKARYCEGRTIEIIRRSDERIDSPCNHFGECGGCTWLDLDYARQLHYKRRQVVDCLRHIGRFEDIDVADIVPSREQFYYRNKMEFSANAADGTAFTLGLHRRGRFDEIFDVTDCLLQSTISNEILARFREYMIRYHVPAYHVSDHTGYMRFLVIREGKNTGQIMLNVVTGDGELPGKDDLVASLTDAFPGITTIVHNITTRISNVARGERELIIYGDGYIVDELLDRSFKIYANSFFQTNTRQAETLYAAALDMLDVSSSDRLLDLYCGTGTIGLCIAADVARVVGIDIEPAAIAAAEANAADNGITNAEFHAAAAREILSRRPELFTGLTGAVVDPPRAGLHPKVIRKLIELNFPKIVYISCNPATFARDAAIFADSNYRLSRIIPVDMFPHTMHVELVAGFKRKD